MARIKLTCRLRAGLSGGGSMTVGSSEGGRANHSITFSRLLSLPAIVSPAESAGWPERARLGPRGRRAPAICRCCSSRRLTSIRAKLLVGHDPAPYFTRRGLGCFIIVRASRRERTDRAWVGGMLAAVSARRHSRLICRFVLLGRRSAHLGGLCGCTVGRQGRRIYACAIFGMSEGGRRCVPGFACGRDGLPIWTEARFCFRQPRSPPR